jgi:hypothetical protein
MIRKRLYGVLVSVEALGPSKWAVEELLSTEHVPTDAD